MKKIILLVIVAIVVTVGVYALSSLSRTDDASVVEDDSTINIIVSVLPQVDFVQRIGGDKVHVAAMIPPGFSPATYDPSPSQLQQLQDADMYFRIGHIQFEKAQMTKLGELNPDMTIIDTSQGITLRTLAAHSHDEEEGGDHYDEEYEHAEDHKHEIHEENHGHNAGDDPHIWLAPQLVKIQAKHIYNALVAHSPSDAAYFTQNYNQFISDLDALDTELTAAFAPIVDQTILVFHPAFGYLADAYGFYQEAIEIEGKDPTPTQLQNIIAAAKEDHVKVIFVQAQFSTKGAESVAQAIGGAVVQIDPLAQDYFSNLRQMAQTIVTAL
jgi:zinc transport system substrate-binding protein